MFGGGEGEDDRTIIDIQVSTLGKYTTSWEYPVQIEMKTQIFFNFSFFSIIHTYKFTL
jgi:hypothetical protein